METMEHEYKLLNMLGYKIKPLYEARWNILDENDNVVGFIQRKKLVNKNKKKEKPAVFGYVTKIDSDTISYNGRRLFGDDNELFNYAFDVKKDNEETDHVEMNCGQFSSITIWSKEHGFMHFHIGYDGLFANFKSKTENFNTEEVVIFKWHKNGERDTDYEKEYVYQIGYCDKHIELTNDDSKGRTTREISAKYHPQYQEHNKIELEERTWIDDKLMTNRKNKYDGTVEETVQKHQMGIDAISHFRYLLNSILPFKQEAISAIVARTPYIVEQGMELFLPDIIEELKENPCLNCSTKGTCDMLGITEQNCLTLKNHKQLTGKPYIKY